MPLYGPDGSPLPVEESINGTAKEKRQASQHIRKSYANYFASLYGLNQSALYRATEPFQNHAWVYCTAMLRAINLSQAPFYVYRETEDFTTRRMRTKSMPRAGRKRRAVHRHLTKNQNPSRFAGLKVKELEPDFEHPLYDVFHRANEHMTGNQLWQITELFMATKGEAFWYLASSNDRPYQKGEVPLEIHPLNPDAVREVVDQGVHVGWEYRSGRYTTGEYVPMKSQDQTIYLTKGEIIHFKYINPENMLRGFSPVGPTAMAIKTDMLSKQHNQSVLENGANPGGLLIDKGGTEPWTAEEEEEFVDRWEQRHRGPGNRGELAILTGSLEYVNTGMSPRDMDYLESIRYNREEVFGSMRVPKSVAGITDQLNYATQLGQDFNFWDKCLIPEVRYFEDLLDGTIFFNQTDDVVGAFDLSGVEALRQSLVDKIEVVDRLTSQNIHMPPSKAFEVVGLTVPGYAGDDTAFVNPSNAIPSVNVVEDPPNPDPDPSFIRPSRRPDDEEQEVEEPMVMDDEPTVEEQQQVFDAVANSFEPAWSSSISKIQQKYEASGEGRISQEDVASALKEGFSKAYATALGLAYDYTTSREIHNSEVPIDHPEIFEWLQNQANRLTQTTFTAIQSNLSVIDSKSISEGERKSAVDQLFTILASEAKTKLATNIEADSFIRSLRDELFRLSESTPTEWRIGNG